jgi:hypothetical protein
MLIGILHLPPSCGLHFNNASSQGQQAVRFNRGTQWMSPQNGKGEGSLAMNHQILQSCACMHKVEEM